MPDTSIFGRSPRASWQPDGSSPSYFPLKSVQESGAMRLTPRERLYRFGAKQDSTGGAADGWATLSHFYNPLHEEGIVEFPYPDTLNKLIRLLKVDEPGTLTLPTRGPIRARPHTWTRTEGDEKTDFATLQINWVADNEDAQTAASFFPPQARSAARALAVRVVAGLQAEGVWHPTVSGLVQLCHDLERASLAPIRFADDVSEKANAVVRSVDEIKRNFMAPARATQPAGRVLLLSPSSWAVGLLLTKLRELAVRARGATPGQAGTVARVYDHPVSIADVAAETGQPLDDLAGLNAGLPDQRWIVPGTPVLVRRSVRAA